MNDIYTYNGKVVILNATPPNILYDGNTVAWYDYKDLNTFTLTSDSSVSQWNDKLGSGHDLIQSSTALKPKWTSTGVLFDGTDDYLQTLPFTLNQPEFVYLVVKQMSWNLNEIMLDGSTATYCMIQQNNATPEIRAYAGTGSTPTAALGLDQWGIVRVLFNGASSKLIVNNGTPITGDFGAFNAGGLTLGARAIGVACVNMEVKELIVRKTADDSTTENAIYNYLKYKHMNGPSLSSGVSTITTFQTIEPETTALLARMSVQPSPALKDLINKTIKGYKDNGIWDTKEFIYHTNLHTEQASQLNWKADEYNLTTSGSPTWQAKIGYTGGASKYLRNGFYPFAHVKNASLNNATITVAISNDLDISGTTGCDLGMQSSTTKFNIFSRYGNLYYGQVNCAIATSPSASNTVGTGIYETIKIESGKYRHCKNGSFLSEVSVTNGVELPNVEFIFMGLNNSGTPQYFSPNRIYTHFSIGTGYADSSMSAYYNIINSFNANVGYTF